MDNEPLNVPTQVTNTTAVPSSGNVDMPVSPKTTSHLGIIGGIVVVLLLIAGGVYGYMAYGPNSSKVQAAPAKLVRIGLSLDSVKIQRWADERDIMTQKAADLGATVTTFSAENDDATQISQIENLISQKVDVIIVVPHNSDLVGPVLTKAQQAGIKVIAYDRLTKGTPDLYLSFDSIKVGNNAVKYVVDAIDPSIKVPSIAFVGGSDADNNGHLVHDGAMQVLEPLVKAGKIKLVYNEYTHDWNPSTAYTNIKKLLDSGVHVDGIAVGNDGMAYGVVRALTEHGLAGKVPVSGQDGELQALQRIVQGTQTMTSWKPGRPLAERAVVAAIDMADGKAPETNGTVNNGAADIKSYLFGPIVVTKDNIRDTVIKDGVFTEAQVYATSTQ